MTGYSRTKNLVRIAKHLSFKTRDCASATGAIISQGAKMKTQTRAVSLFLAMIALICLLGSSNLQTTWAESGSNPPALISSFASVDQSPVTTIPQVSRASAATSSFVAIAAGESHTCALTNTGGVKCWGSNAAGQLGDGTTTQRLTPVDVSGLTSGVSLITTGWWHTCALLTSGGIKCWGINAVGQLGDGTTTNRLTPVDVSGLTSGVSAILAGAYHTCAVTTSGGIKCWGSNVYGQLGDGTTTRRLTPVNVTGLSDGLSAVVAGGEHTCALTTTNAVKCWGKNSYGQLGDGSTTNRSTPVTVTGLTVGASGIVAGRNHTCALTAAGGLKCWGDNSTGQLGDNTTTSRSTPTDVSGLASGVGKVATVGDFTCALTNAGGIKCWGQNSSGQLGDGSTTQRLTPVNVSGLTSGASSVMTGAYHTCAMMTNGGVKCWGQNSSGQLGDGTTTQRLTPVDIVTPATNTYSIAGRVTTDEGVPLGDALVDNGNGQTVMTDSNGYYGFGGLPAGTYTVTSSKEGYTIDLIQVTIAPNAVGKNLKGRVTPACYTLTIQQSTGGTITKSPSTGNCNNGNGYSSGTTVNLTAKKDPGYKFGKWGGDAKDWGTAEMAKITMTGDKSVTASFSLTASTIPIVVLVHGWHGGGKRDDKCEDTARSVTTAEQASRILFYDFGVFAGKLLEEGKEVYVVSLKTGPSGTPPIEDNATCLSHQLANLSTNGRAITLIGHSMGGLVSRAYLESGMYEPKFLKVSRLITLGTPHTGMTYGTLRCATNSSDKAACDFSTAGMVTFNRNHSKRASGVTYDFIGGISPTGTSWPVVLQDGPNDGAVGVNSALGKRYLIVGGLPVITTEIKGVSSRTPVLSTHAGSLGYPSYFEVKANDRTTVTDAYNCVSKLLKGQTCPSSSMPQPRAPKATVVSQTPALSGHLSTGQAVARTTPVDSSGPVQFNLTWITGTVGLTLRNPSGTLIDPAYAAAHPSEVTYTSNITDTNSQLFVSYAFTTTVAGTYTLNITAGDVGAGGTDYTVYTYVDSPRTLTVSTDNTLYAVGSTATISATLQNNGSGMTGASVQANLSRDGAIIGTVALTDQGNGNYLGNYLVPNMPGYLGFVVIAQGNDGGVSYARESTSLLPVSSTAIQLSGSYTDDAFDTDGNGKLDSLNVAIGVNSNQAGNYILSGDLIGAGNTLVAHSAVSVTLTTGTITATLHFDGDSIGQSGINGPYTLTNLTITDQ